jgi:hypothetical protein
MKLILWICLCFALVACSGLPAQTSTPDYSDLVITLERTVCFGACPAYHLTIYRDGRVVYEGKAFVAVEGTQTTQISAEQVAELVMAFETAGYFSLEENYTVAATDLPTTITSITINGQSKRISHYGIGGSSDLDSAPRELYELENKIDEIVNSNQWVGN